MLVKITNKSKTLVDFCQGPDLEAVKVKFATAHPDLDENDTLAYEVITDQLTAMEIFEQFAVVNQPGGWFLRTLPVYGITPDGNEVALKSLKIGKHDLANKLISQDTQN